MDVVELRVRLEEATGDALEVADKLAAGTAAGDAGPQLAEAAANYLQLRALIRRLRRQLVVEVAG